MKKLFAFILILVLASAIGGVYGIIHDQITYTISEEYYSKFKFIQFGLHNWGLGHNIGTEQLPEIKLINPRFGVGLVGFLATWWMGLFIGIILGLISFIHKDARAMFFSSMKAFIIVIIVAFFIGGLGWAYGKLFLIKNYPNWFLPEHVINVDIFITVGSIHNFGYLGGVIGLVFAVFYTIKQKTVFKKIRELN